MLFIKKRWPLSLIICLVVYGLYFLRPFADGTDAFFRLDSILFNGSILPRSTGSIDSNTKVIVVEINDSDIDRFGPWPWSRETITVGLEQLARQRPKAVVLGFYIDPKRNIGEYRVSNLVSRSPLVVGFRFKNKLSGQFSGSGSHLISKASFAPQAIVTSNSGIFYLPGLQPTSIELPMEDLSRSAKSMGFLDFPLHESLYGYPLVRAFHGKMYKSLAYSTAEIAFASDVVGNPVSKLEFTSSGLGAFYFNKKRIFTLKDGTMLLRPYRSIFYGGNYAFRRISYANLLEGKFDKENFRNAVVFIDINATGYGQKFQTFDGSLATRASIQATAYTNLIQNDFLRRSRLTQIVELLLVLFAVLTGAIVSYKLRSILAIGAAFVVIPSIVWTIGLVGAKFFNTWLMISYAIVGLLVSFTSQFGFKNIIDDRRRRTVERALTGYTSKAVMDSLIHQGESFLTTKGDRCDISVLLFDIIGFTSLVKKLTPEETFTFLNHIFSITDEIITEKHNGIIDKKMGDACIALFGLEGQDDHALRAVKTALDINEALFDRFAELSKLAHQKDFGPGTIQVRVGISTGNVCIGNVGSSKHMNYTAVGENVNLAQRLESACRPGEVLVSEETYNRIADQIEAEKIEAHGKREEETYVAYRVLNLKS